MAAAAEQVVSELILRARAEYDQAIGKTESLTKVQESAIKAAERQTRAWDAQARSQHNLEQGARTYVRLQEQGLAYTEIGIKHLQALTAATEKHTKTHNDNSNALRSHEWVNFSRQLQDVTVGLYSGQAAMTVFLQQGTQMFDILASRQGGFLSGLKALGGTFASAITPMRLFGAGAVAAFAAIEIGAVVAHSKLVALGAEARKLGVSASAITRSRAVGAGAGLSSEESDAALKTATQQFEQFQRNSGSVLDFFKKFDASALGSIDRAKGFTDWIGRIGEEVKRLGGEQGLDLAQRLLGDDQGRALVDNMDAFLGSLRKTTEPIDAAASSADALSRQLAQASAEVDNKLLNAFAEVKVLSADIQNIWLSIKSMFADFVSAAGQAYRTARSYIPDWTSPTGFMMTPQQLPDITIGGGNKSVGATRSLYPEKAKSGGKSDAEKEAEKYEKITKDLEQQIRLVSARGDAHKQVQWEIEKENWLEKLGADASAEHKQHIEDLAEKLRAAREEQDRLNEAAKAFNEAYGEIATTVSSALKDLAKGGKFDDVLKSLSDRFQNNAFDAVLTGAGPFAKMFGLNGKDGATGGLFGGIASMFGLGDGMSTQQMNVTAANVNLSGGIGGAAAGAGGWLVDAIKSIFPFENGGIMTSAGPVPLRAYAGGGIANSPQMALFGEGSRPEAFVPLPDGKRIPVNMNDGGGRSAAAPVTVNLIGAPAGARVKDQTDSKGARRIDVVFDERVASAMSSIHGQAALRANNGLAPRVARR